MKYGSLLLIALLLITALPAAAQGPKPQAVEVAGYDGWTLAADYYAPDDIPDGGVPAVLLLHMCGSSKAAWGIFAPDLLAAGYAALAPDMRGGGATRGSMTAENAQRDVQTWLDWLREQPGIDPDRLNIIGGSCGAILALRGMANDPGVVTAVALSPVWEYSGLTTEDAIQTIDTRPVFLVAAQRDTDSADAVKRLAALALGDVLLRVYPRSAHGTGLFMTQDDLAPSILTWLDAHNRN